MTAPVATRRTRKTSTRPARRRRLPRLGWGWAALAITLIAIARTWPIWTAGAVALLATASILRAIRPQRLARLWTGLERITARRRTLPRNGARTLNTFLHMHHDQFEHAIADLANEHPDVHTATKSGGTGDRGLDVLVQLRNGARILIQCKHYAPGHNNVGGPDVREIVGSVIAHRCHHGVIVTTSDFTNDAYDTNRDLDRNSLTLINGPRLVAWANGGTPPWT